MKMGFIRLGICLIAMCMLLITCQEGGDKKDPLSKSLFEGDPKKKYKMNEFSHIIPYTLYQMTKGEIEQVFVFADQNVFRQRRVFFPLQDTVCVHGVDDGKRQIQKLLRHSRKRQGDVLFDSWRTAQAWIC